MLPRAPNFVRQCAVNPDGQSEGSVNQSLSLETFAKGEFSNHYRLRRDTEKNIFGHLPLNKLLQTLSQEDDHSC